MSQDTHRLSKWEDLAPGDQQLFVRQAGDALKRRDTRFFGERRALWIDWVLTGAIGCVGLLVLKWSATTAVMLLLATFWLGWLADVALWRLRAANLPVSYVREGEDQRFWQIVAILRGKRRQAPDVRGHPSIVLSLCVDLIAGGAAMAILLRGLDAAGVDLLAAAMSPSLLLSVALLAVVGIGPSLRARLRIAEDGGVQLPVFSVGQRGIGLLVMIFGLMAAGGGTLAASVLMGCVYGFFVLMGGIELIWGLPRLRKEVDWVRRQRALASEDGGVSP